jgi:4'-phosphopantetheinyl transferase
MVSRTTLAQIKITELSRASLLEPSVPNLLSSEIHIWDFPLSIEGSLDRYSKLLSQDEVVRAARFRFEKDARRFTVARASVRSILGAYVHCGGHDLHFEYSRQGKPSLDGISPNIHFSVSHSGELAMLALALDGEIGVDLELMRPEVEIQKLSERFFSPAERDSLRALSDNHQVAAFFRCWTCKEAFLKAQGVGLSRSLDSFDVEVNPERPARILATRPDAEEAQRWSMRDIPADAGYAAALSARTAISSIQISRCR